MTTNADSLENKDSKFSILSWLNENFEKTFLVAGLL